MWHTLIETCTPLTVIGPITLGSQLTHNNNTSLNTDTYYSRTVTTVVSWSTVFKQERMKLRLNVKWIVTQTSFKIKEYNGIHGCVIITCNEINKIKFDTTLYNGIHRTCRQLVIYTGKKNGICYSSVFWRGNNLVLNYVVLRDCACRQKIWDSYGDYSIIFRF